MWYAFAPDR